MTTNKPAGGPNMQKKLLLKDLAKYLAADSKLTEQASEEFIRLFFSTIQDGLNKDGQVKIKGWGTFKVIETSDRTSVDVSTGNRITIDGYKKLTFVPEASLKDIINKPFSSFETVPLDEDYVESPDEIIEHQVAADNADDDSTNEETVNKSNIVEPVIDQATQIFTDTKMEKTSEEPAKVETAEVTKVDETNETAQEAESTEVAEKPTTNDQNEKVSKSTTNITSCGLPKQAEELSDKDFVFYLPKESHGYYWYIWVPILLCLIIGAGLYCIFQDDVTGNKLPFGRKGKNELAVMNSTLTPVDYVDSSYSDTTCIAVTTDTPQAVEPMIAVKQEGAVKQEVAVEPTTVIVPKVTVEPQTVEPAQLTDTAKSSIPLKAIAKGDSLTALSPAPIKEVIPSEPYTLQLTDALKQKPLKDITPADTTSYVMVGTMTTHAIMSSETLISVSLYYYGDKRLWPYLVKYNNIKEPNNVAIGQKIKIPYLKRK